MQAIRKAFNLRHALQCGFCTPGNACDRLRHALAHSRSRPRAHSHRAWRQFVPLHRISADHPGDRGRSRPIPRLASPYSSDQIRLRLGKESGLWWQNRKLRHDRVHHVQTRHVQTRHARPRSVSRRRFLAGGAGALSAGRCAARLQAQRAPVKIGVILYLTGVQSFMGQQTRKGNEFGAKIVKEAGGPPMEFIYGDAESKPESGRIVAERLIRDGCHAADRHQRFRQHHLGRAGGGSGKDSVPHQYRIGAADHRAGLHADLPEFPAGDRARRQCGRAHQGARRGHRRGAEDGRHPSRQRHVRAGRDQGRGRALGTLAGSDQDHGS